MSGTAHRPAIYVSTLVRPAVTNRRTVCVLSIGSSTDLTRKRANVFDPPLPSTHRDIESIVADLERLCQEDGFVYTFLLSAYCALFVSPDMVVDIDWSRRPNHQELAFLLGLIVKHPLSLRQPSSVEMFNRQNRSVHDLLEELHRTLSSAKLNAEFGSQECGNVNPRSRGDSTDESLGTNRAMVEPLFYGEEGGYSFQYAELAAKRYRRDADWIESHLGTRFQSIIEISQHLGQLLGERASRFEFTDNLQDMCDRLLEVFLFRFEELRGTGDNAVAAFLREFSLTPGTANQGFGAIGDYNEVHSHPVILVGDNTFLFPIHFYLDKSSYESPYYWMLKDPSYRESAFRNRGDATEEICCETLQTVFGARGVHRNVRIRHQNKDVTDIDLLAVNGNKALVVQAKSKKLTVESRRGDSSSLIDDFQSAVQDAYDQALLSRTAVIGSGFELTDKDGNTIELEQPIDDAYVVCVTGDHYPMLPLQTALYLKKQDSDPYPVTMSVFDLDVLSFYLNDPFELLYYIRQRTRHARDFWSISEKALLAFHLKWKLLPHDQSNRVVVDQDVAQLIDSHFPAERGYWQKTKASNRLFRQWGNEAFTRLVSTVKRMEQAGLADAVFFLYELAGSRGDTLIDGINKIKRATLLDGKIHDLSMPMPDEKRGVSFVSFPEPQSDIEVQGNLTHLKAFALARKYKSYADEWLVFASMAGSSDIVDMAWYSKDNWQFDDELDEMARELFSSGRVANASGRRLQRKPTRNQPCPCGSQLKYKRCHGG